MRFEASDLYYSKGSLDSKGAPPRLRAEPAAGEIAPPLREMAEITRHECVGPAVHGGLEHEFVSPLKLPASIKAAAARLAGNTRHG